METYWVPGVNNLRTHGRWAFQELADVYEMEAEFEKKVAGAVEQMIAKVAGGCAVNSATPFLKSVDLHAVLADRGLQRVDLTRDRFFHLDEAPLHLGLDDGCVLRDGADLVNRVFMQDVHLVLDVVEAHVDPVESLVDVSERLIDSVEPLFVHGFLRPAPRLKSRDDDTSSFRRVEGQTVCRVERRGISSKAAAKSQNLQAAFMRTGAESATC
jgi:hypothetical protein